MLFYKMQMNNANMDKKLRRAKNSSILAFRKND